jgi:hypothetical protein
MKGLAFAGPFYFFQSKREAANLSTALLRTG